MRPQFQQLDGDLAEQIITEAKIVLAEIGVDVGDEETRTFHALLLDKLDAQTKAMQSQGEDIRSEIQQVSKETKETIEGLRADFESRLEQLRNSWYDIDEATSWANEG